MEGFKVNLVRSEEHFQSYCNKVFAGWDFCITNRSMADRKHSSLRLELRVSAAGFSCWGRELGGGQVSPVLSKPLLCSFREPFTENTCLGLITSGSSVELVNWGWEEGAT